MQPIEIIGIMIEIQFSCQLQKIWASGQSKTLGPTKRRLKNGETSVTILTYRRGKLDICRIYVLYFA